ncbi:MAG: ankyrin repeat domain-containing protein [Candidatus Babeliales bacterium]
MKQFTNKLLIIALWCSATYQAHAEYQKQLTPLEERFLQAAKNDNMRELKDAIKARVNVLVRDGTGYQALHWAARNGNNDAITLLVDEGANAEDAENRDHLTPAQVAHDMHHRDTEAMLTKIADDQAARRRVKTQYYIRSTGSIKTNPRE